LLLPAAYLIVLQADGLLQRHSHLPLVNEAAAVLVHASKHGPAALQVRAAGGFDQVWPGLTPEVLIGVLYLSCIVDIVT
jgi:hypothetical protein